MASLVLILQEKQGNSLVVQWLRLCTSTPEGAGSIPGWGMEIPRGVAKKKKKKKKKQFQSFVILFQATDGQCHHFGLKRTSFKGHA